MHADGSKEYYFKDHIGSARVVLARSAAGVVTVKAKYEYKPFGGLVSSSSGKSDRHGYAGDEFDFESDLVDMGARMYMPEIGRFLSVDPLAEAFPTQSPYNFAYNNPINFRDPSGLAPEKEKGDRVLSYQGYMSMEESLSKALSTCEESNRRSYNMFNLLSIRWRSDCARLAAWGNEIAIGLSYGPGGGGNGVSKGAWQITNSWTQEMKDGYAKFYTKRTSEAVENKEKYDCCDFQVRMITEYARDNGLPLSFMTRGGKELNMQDYEDFDSFWKDVSGALSAKNLDLLYNVDIVNTDGEFLPGDMKLLKIVNRIESTTSFHVVGYTGLGGNDALVQGNYFIANNKPAEVQHKRDYTNRSCNYNILSYENGECQYGMKGWGLRWSFDSFQKRKK